MLSTGLKYIITAFCIFPAICIGQQNDQSDRNNIKAPAFPEPEYSAPLKIADGQDDQNAVIISESNRGQANSNGNFSPTAIPANNDCLNAITLTVNAACVNGTNKEATTQSGESTACQGSITKTVWYKFTAAASSMYVEVELTATSGCYLSSAVYSGSCLPSAVLSCENASGGPNLNIHNLTGLTVGNTYFVQVSYTGGSLCGNNSNANTGANFCIRAGTPQACATCATPCGPMCIFPSAPTVAQVTSTCTQYQLTSRLNAGQSRTQCYTFTAVAASFSLQMIINTVGCGAGGNVSAFNWQLYPASCASVVQSGNLSNLNATGLTIGAAYVLCYSWTATCQHNSVYPYMVATSPLPVSWLRFEGKQLEKDILLLWSTASEINNAFFSVERSADGISFESIAHISGEGTSNNTSSYRFTDYSPFKGINYYRIHQVDYDGQSSSSGIIAIRYYHDYSVKVENNPVEEELQVVISSEKASQIKMQLINDLGECVKEFSRSTTKGSTRLSIPMEQLKSGMYFLKIEGVQGTTWTRFLKL